MRADLHLHSVYSDGKYTPDKIASLAVERGVGMIAITDHDNMQGMDEKVRAGREHGLLYVRGWEVSAYADCKVHILGYGCATNEAYEKFLADRRTAGEERARDVIRKLNEAFGLTVTMEEVEGYHLKKETPVHTMHVASAFSDRIGIPSGEVYAKYMQYGTVGYSDIGRPTPEEAIDVILKTGGVPVLAHPGRIHKNAEEKKELVKRLKDRGLFGIECYYTTHTERETEEYLAWTKELDLLVTGGSDTHVLDGVHDIGKPCFEPSERLLQVLFPDREKV